MLLIVIIIELLKAIGPKLNCVVNYTQQVVISVVSSQPKSCKKPLKPKKNNLLR